MRLSIVNYPKSISPKMKTTVTTEDDELLKQAKERVDEMNFGRGALIISEVLHTDLANLNNRVYKKKGMAESVQSFVDPYPTPFIMHHDLGGGGMFGGGDPKLLSNGSNVVANYYSRRTETVNGIASGYVKVGTFIPNSAMIGNQRVIDAIQSRQLYALSIGASVQEANHRCSICGNPIYSEECDHRTGQIYDGVKCLAEIYNPLFKEYSAVYNPSDVVAAIRRMDLNEAEKNPLLANECRIIDNGFDVCELSLYELSSKVYASSDIPLNTQSKEEGHQANMETNETTPVAPTTPQPAPVAIDERAQTQSAAPSTTVTSQDSLVAKALDIISDRCTKSDEVVMAALGLIKEMTVKVGGVRTDVAPEVPATTETTTTTPVANTESSEPASQATTEPAASTEPTTQEIDTTVPASAPAQGDPATTAETQTTDEPVPATEAAPAPVTEPDSQPVSTSEAVPSTEGSPAKESIAVLLAKRRTAIANNSKSKKGFNKRPGRQF